MSKKFGFFNSINGDRKYLASDLSQAFDIGITTGLKQEEGNLEVVPYQGMQVQIQPGSAMIHGHFFVNDEPEIITLDVADAELNRIDRIVLRYDAYAREINTAVIKGTPAVNPNPPARLETPEQFDLVLADIYIPAGAVEINQSNITDMRDSELCGYIGVKGAVSQLQFDAHLSENSGKHITESGENENGRYIKFDDGTMICRGEKTVTAQVNIPWGSLYYCTIGIFVFPHAFVEKPYVIPLNLSNMSIIPSVYIVNQTYTEEVSIYKPVADYQEYDYTVGYVAIGRWK